MESGQNISNWNPTSSPTNVNVGISQLLDYFVRILGADYQLPARSKVIFSGTPIITYDSGVPYLYFTANAGYNALRISAYANNQLVQSLCDIQYNLSPVASAEATWTDSGVNCQINNPDTFIDNLLINYRIKLANIITDGFNIGDTVFNIWEVSENPQTFDTLQQIAQEINSLYTLMSGYIGNYNIGLTPVAKTLITNTKVYTSVGSSAPAHMVGYDIYNPNTQGLTITFGKATTNTGSGDTPVFSVSIASKTSRTVILDKGYFYNNSSSYHYVSIANASGESGTITAPTVTQFFST